MKRSVPLRQKKPMNRGTSELRRSGLGPRALVKPSARIDKAVKAQKVYRYKKVPPNAEERAWMAFVAGFGCVVCWLHHAVKTPCAVHHIIEGGRRVGHLFTIGLCDPGHHQGAPVGTEKVSRHPWKARFETEYGTEYELHAYLVEQHKAVKVVEAPCR